MAMGIPETVIGKETYVYFAPWGITIYVENVPVVSYEKGDPVFETRAEFRIRARCARAIVDGLKKSPQFYRLEYERLDDPPTPLYQ